MISATASLIVSAGFSRILFVIALDVSRSMLAADVVPSRLSRARDEIARVLDGGLNARVGLVLFAGQALVQCPLTNDLGALALFLSEASTDMITSQGTALRSALEVSLDLLAAAERDERTRRSIVLISDGEDFEGGWEETVGRCADEDVAVTVIAVGLEERALMKLPTGDDYVMDEARPAMTRVDLGTLEEVARRTGGGFFRLARRPLDAEAFRRAVIHEEAGRTGSSTVVVPEERRRVNHGDRLGVIRLRDAWCTA